VDGPQPLRSKQSHPVFVTAMSMPQDSAPCAFLCPNSFFHTLPLEKARVTQRFADVLDAGGGSQQGVIDRDRLEASTLKALSCTRLHAPGR
jgi:hypothetical protein